MICLQKDKLGESICQLLQVDEVSITPRGKDTSQICCYIVDQPLGPSGRGLHSVPSIRTRHEEQD